MNRPIAETNSTKEKPGGLRPHTGHMQIVDGGNLVVSALIRKFVVATPSATSTRFQDGDNGHQHNL
jgi:hypothetical protein